MAPFARLTQGPLAVYHLPGLEAWGQARHPGPGTEAYLDRWFR